MDEFFPTPIPTLTPEQEKILLDIRRDHMEALIAAKRDYDDKLQAIHARQYDEMTALVEETSGMTPDEFAAWRQERGS